MGRSKHMAPIHARMDKITAPITADVKYWFRKTNNIANADLCNKFADEIYLPKIVLKKADIPLSLRSQFIDLR